MRLLVGSSNHGKFIEIGEALSGTNVSLVRPADANITGSPDEIGATYRENAAIKAFYYHGLSGLPTVADDSGIVVEALQDELGVQTRRWGAGPEASDAEWISTFLDTLRHEKNRRARFICNIAYIGDDGTLHTFEGVCNGSITDDLEADYLPGLPISGCFRPDGSTHVYSALSVVEKNRISHRGKALSQFREHLIYSLDS